MDFENLLNFERASVATYYDADGVLQTAAIDEPRLDHDPVTLEPLGLLVEEERTNILLNSDSPVDQSVTLAAGQYTLSTWGAGSVLIGAYGSASDGSPLTFTATAGIYSVVTTGELERFQLEEGGFATSYIPTTGAPVTRSPDVCSVKSVDPWIDQNEGTLYVQLNKKAGSYVGNYLTLSDGTASHQVVIKDRSVFYKETNYMPSPFDPSGWNTDNDASITEITGQNPSGSNVYAEIEQIDTSTAVFSQSSNQTFLAGDEIYLCCIAKQDIFDMDLSFYFQEDAGFDRFVINVADGEVKRTSFKLDYKYENIANNWKLIQIKNTLDTDLTSCRGEFRLRDGSLGVPPIGAKVFMQAVFFGKANDCAPVRLLTPA